ncbi:hypothetical protein ACWC10_29940 [Streptomyces sp. NPDC001595]|uniref:hypothetical protein n=1 Tax=Streptomyces sp. NPDC001532 TaxID=3154520 RepID=UPI00332CC2CC
MAGAQQDVVAFAEAGVGQEREDCVTEPSGEDGVVVGAAGLAAAVDVAADQSAEPSDRLQVFSPQVVDGFEGTPGLFGPVAVVARFAADAQARAGPEGLAYLHALVAANFAPVRPVRRCGTPEVCER